MKGPALIAENLKIAISATLGKAVDLETELADSGKESQPTSTDSLHRNKGLVPRQMCCAYIWMMCPDRHTVRTTESQRGHRTG